RKTSGGSVEYAFSPDVTPEVLPPDNPINARHAELFEDLGPPPDAVRKPENHPAGPTHPPAAIVRARTAREGERNRGSSPGVGVVDQGRRAGPTDRVCRGNRSTPGRAGTSARSTATPANRLRAAPADRVGRRAGFRQQDGATMKSTTSATSNPDRNGR